MNAIKENVSIRISIQDEKVINTTERVEPAIPELFDIELPRYLKKRGNTCFMYTYDDLVAKLTMIAKAAGNGTYIIYANKRTSGVNRDVAFCGIGIKKEDEE